jgi:hypothetical protein
MTVLGVVAGVAAVALIATLLVVFREKPEKTDPGPSAPPNTIYVSRTGKGSLESALESAFKVVKADGRIVVRDGPLEFAPRTIGPPYIIPKNVTLEAEPGVEWRLRRGNVQSQPWLITLAHLDGFTLKGFTFDGENRVKDLIQVKGTCPGLVLEDLTLKNFERSGIFFLNCEGSRDRPVTIRKIYLSASKQVEAGFVFDLDQSIIKDIPVNRFITFGRVDQDARTKFKSLYSARPEVIDDKSVNLPK